MTDAGRLTDAERGLAADLKAAIVPPATPARLHEAVERMAIDAASDQAGGSAGPRAAGGHVIRLARVALAAAAVFALVAVALVLVRGRIDPSQVGATPHPTLPALVGPALPTPGAGPTMVTIGAWVDSSTAWTVDDVGGLRMTTDGALTWSEPRPVPDPAMTGLQFLDALHGSTTWAAPRDGAGPLVAYRTSDGGRTWLPMTIGTVPVAPGETLLAAVHFSDASHAIAQTATVVESQVAFKRCGGFVTDDGGSSWTALASAPCFTSVFWDGAVGFAPPVGDGTEAQATTDGGRTWQSATLPGTGGGVEFWPSAVVRGEGDRARVVGTFHQDGAGSPPVVVLESGDGGRTWHEASRTPLADDATPQSVSALDADHWLALADAPTTERPFSSTTIEETWDGGRTWTTAGDTGTIQASWASWGDRLHGLVQGVDMGDCSDPARSCGGNGTVFLTNDGGRTWHQVPY